MYKRKRLGPLRTVAIRNSEVGRYSEGVNVQYEWQKKSVPEGASAIWSESAIGEVRYRRFHCSILFSQSQKFLTSGGKPWTIVRDFCQGEEEAAVRGVWGIEKDYCRSPDLTLTHLS